MRTHPIVEYYQALRDSAPCLSRAATLPKGTKLGLGKRRAPGNTIILSQPYRRRVSTDRLNREGSQLTASLEGEPGPTPAGKTLPHSFPETSRFRRERAREQYVTLEQVPQKVGQRILAQCPDWNWATYGFNKIQHRSMKILGVILTLARRVLYPSKQWNIMLYLIFNAPLQRSV